MRLWQYFLRRKVTALNALPYGEIRKNMKKVFRRSRGFMRLEAEGFLARAICHENDHLDGRIFKDITHHMLSEEELRRLDEE